MTELTYKDLPRETKKTYARLDHVSKQYPLEFIDGVLRFKRNVAIQYCIDHISLNDMWVESSRNRWPITDLMTIYRMMGYSLCGFMEIFEDHIAEGKL